MVRVCSAVSLLISDAKSTYRPITPDKIKLLLLKCLFNFCFIWGKSLIAQWLRPASQGHEMCCPWSGGHGSWLKLGRTSVLAILEPKNYNFYITYHLHSFQIYPHGIFFNSYSASHGNWCTGTHWNRIMTAQCEGMGEVGSARYEPALLPPCPSIRVLSYSNSQEIHSRQQTGLAV